MDAQCFVSKILQGIGQILAPIKEGRIAPVKILVATVR
jgi:hypothetical protein